MRNPDNTYITLKDRATYLLENQIRIVNGYRNKGKASEDAEFRKYCFDNMHRSLARFEAMCEMFDCTFRDYTTNIELTDKDEYVFWIEGR